MSQIVKTPKQVVAALGGTGETAKILGLGPSAVSNMLHDGEIRRAYHLILTDELERRGFVVDHYELGWLRRRDISSAHETAEAQA
jgi:hypothetical protein